ncbi:MAG: hypothetical protein ACK4Q5_08635 [Saprospiraceae bacterium]
MIYIDLGGNFQSWGTAGFVSRASFEQRKEQSENSAKVILVASRKMQRNDGFDFQMVRF